MFDVVFIYSRKSPHPCHCAYILSLSAVVYQYLQAHFTINNGILMRMSLDQADRMLRL